MSIRDWIAYWIGKGRLFVVSPVLIGSPTVRTLIVSEEINKLLVGPYVDQEEEERCGQLLDDFDRFVTGRRITMALDPYNKPPDTYMAKIDPPEDQVWDIRSRDPEPQLRIFGLFSEPNTFVALTWYMRDDLPAEWNWDNAREGCKAEWRKLFGTEPPHGGAKIHDYVTSNAIPV